MEWYLRKLHSYILPGTRGAISCPNEHPTSNYYQNEQYRKRSRDIPRYSSCFSYCSIRASAAALFNLPFSPVERLLPLPLFREEPLCSIRLLCLYVRLSTISAFPVLCLPFFNSQLKEQLSCFHSPGWLIYF